MKHISLSRLVIKNFRSYAECDITFPRTAGLKCLAGFNNDALGSNGAGKSSLWRALKWCLYGVPRISSVLRWGTEQADVTTYLEINATCHQIRRYGPPGRLELDGKIATQEEINELLGLDHTRFVHSVMFEQGAQLFPDLSMSERGELLDNVLNLSLWQQASERASEKCKFYESEINKKTADLAYVQGKLDTLEKEEDIKNKISLLKEKISEWATEQAKLVKELEQKKIAWGEDQYDVAEQKTRDIEKLEAELKVLQAKHVEHIDTTSEQQLVKDAASMHEELLKQQTLLALATEEGNRIEEEQKLWETKVCSSCKQTISDQKRYEELLKLQKRAEARSAQIEKIFNKIPEFKARAAEREAALKTVREANIVEAHERRSLMKDISHIQSQISMLEKDVENIITALNSNLDPYSKQIEVILKSSNPYEQLKIDTEKQLKQVVKQTKEFLAGKSSIENQITSIQETSVATEYWKHGFKQIRLFFVQQILAALEVEIQSSVTALGLANWKVALKTETETKSGTTKLGVNIEVSSSLSTGNWESWSGGEAQRLRLAIAIGVGSLFQRTAGVQWDLQVFDEPSTHLSGEGIQDLLEALNSRAEMLQAQLWVTDHNAFTYSGFSEIWTVTRTEVGSEVSKTT